MSHTECLMRCSCYGNNLWSDIAPSAWYNDTLYSSNGTMISSPGTIMGDMLSRDTTATIISKPKGKTIYANKLDHHNPLNEKKT